MKAVHPPLHADSVAQVLAPRSVSGPEPLAVEKHLNPPNLRKEAWCLRALDAGYRLMNYYQGSAVPPVTRSCPRKQIGGQWAGELPLVQSQWLHGSPQQVLIIALAVRPGVMRIAKMFESLQVQVQVLDCEVAWVVCRQLALALRDQFSQ